MPLFDPNKDNFVYSVTVGQIPTKNLELSMNEIAV